MSLDTGEVLYKENEMAHLSPASVTKIMTLLLVAEALDCGKIKLEDKVTASAEAVKMGGSQIWLEVGEVMTVEELLKAVIIASANDACTALSEYVGGSVTGFVKMMNKRAAQLGLSDTNFENCNGLDDTTVNHYSCAYDLAVISRELMKHKLIQKYSTVWLDSLRNGETELNNTNKLVNSYNGITGLKTGTTSNAGFCVSATAEREGMGLVAVVLGSDTSEDRFETAAHLLDMGFADYELLTPQLDAKRIKPVAVKNSGKISLTPVYAQGEKLIIRRGSAKPEYQYKLKQAVNAPVEKGDALGEVIISSEGKQLATIALTAPKSVKKLENRDIFNALLRKI